MAAGFGRAQIMRPALFGSNSLLGAAGGPREIASTVIHLSLLVPPSSRPRLAQADSNRSWMDFIRILSRLQNPAGRA